MNIFIPIYVLIILGCVYFIIPRQVNNLIIRIFKRKQYVVCHMIRANTDFIDVYNIVPHPDKLTDVGDKGAYNLDEKFSDSKRNGRLNFILHEGESIPKILKEEEREIFYFRKARKIKISFGFPEKDDLLFQAKSVHNALSNNVAEYLFTKKKDVYYIILALIIAILIVALIYTAYVLNQTNDIMIELANRGLNSQVT